MKVALDAIQILKPTPNVDEEALISLADSMKELGLSQAIVVRPANELGKFFLVSGEKRYLAAKRLEWAEIDVTIREVAEIRGREIRIHENLKRFDIPWPEQVSLIQELHQLRVEEHGEPVRTGRPPKEGPAKEKIGWSLRDTAAELDMGVGSLSEDLSLARALERDPTLAAVTDKKTAVKLARRAAQRFENERSSNLPTTFEANDIYLGDSTDILKQLPPQSIDHFITDPPWIRFFDKSLTLDARTLPVFQELYRVLKTGAVGYIFCGLDDWDYYVGHDEPNPEDPSERIHVIGRLERIGFSVSKTPVIWQKLKSLSRRGVAPWEYARDFEFVIVVAKPPSVLTSARQLSGVKAFNQVHPSSMIHPNEKPVELIEDIIKDCSYEGNIIIDPFAGSGVLGSACKSTKRKYILIERDPDSHAAILKRLGKEE